MNLSNQEKPPKKPLKAFFIYKANVYEEVKKANPNANFIDILKIIAEMWKGLTFEAKVCYEKRAQEEKEVYEGKMKEYEAKYGLVMGSKKERVKNDVLIQKKMRVESSPSRSNDSSNNDDKSNNDGDDDADFAPRSKRPYLQIHVETVNRTIFDRDENGTISISFNPRQNEPVKIGDQVINSPKTLKGQLIEIGSFSLSVNQPDQEFEDAIKSWNPIVYKCLSADPSD